MDTATQIQILDKAVCISHSANTLGKGMSPSIPTAMGKANSSLTLVWETSLEEGKLRIQTC